MNENTSHARTAMFWHSESGGAVRCVLCPHECHIPEGKRGICTVRKNIGGQLFADAYGKITAAALDPIEKKPLYMFHPGSKILSIGSYGCNFRCPFCQNHEIAMPQGEISTTLITPKELLQMARETMPQGNVGVAYTYNEPLINFEFLLDSAQEIMALGLKNVLITNGFINPKPLQMLLQVFDAMNIDLKGFSQNFYKKTGGDLEIVKNTITKAHKACHIEVTTLVIPNENENDIERIAKWLSEISPEIPMHISRFFPRNQYSERKSTSCETILRLAEAARKYLSKVYCGNMLQLEKTRELCCENSSICGRLSGSDLRAF